MNVTKYVQKNVIIICRNGCVLSSSQYTKTRFLPGLRPELRKGSLRRSPAPLVGWGGGHSPVYPSPTSHDAFGVSISAPTAPRLSGPQQKFLATPMRPAPPCLRLWNMEYASAIIRFQ